MFSYICTKLFPTLISKREYRRKFKDVQQKVRFICGEISVKTKIFWEVCKPQLSDSSLYNSK